MEQSSRENGRPDPDALLREVERAESPQGKLKVFLGYSPGVGKTYSMLMEARVRQRRGDDIVVGVVETHGRLETAALLEGLEVLPRLDGDYKGITLGEMNLDAILARRPEAVLVDELAHSNAPWCRHPKRYQDVAEILKAGIDVYSTLNVQHLESQNDVVARITGVHMKETVPDWIVEEAEEIQLIDVPLETLFERLREGKVYIPQEARRATEAFFQRGHLVALREIALNIVARKMDAELSTYRRARAVDVPWPAEERLMVCLGATAGAPELVRKAYRLARARNAEWFAVHVSVPVLGPQSDARQAHLADALNLAEKFGARTVTLSGPDVVPAVLQFARENNVSQIVVGRPHRTGLFGTLRGYPVYRLLRTQREFDLVVVAPGLERRSLRQPKTPRRTKLRGYANALFALALASGLNLLIEPYANPTSLYAIYLLATLVIALFYGLGPSIWIALLSFLTFDFLFVEPKYMLAIKHPTDLVGAVVFLATSIAVGQLIQVSRRQAAALRERAEQSSLLEEMARELLGAASYRIPETRKDARDSIAGTVIRYAAQAAPADVVILFRTSQSRLELSARTREDLELTEEETAVAEWVLAHGDEAGAGTETLPSIPYYFMPM
ncbi:MAG: DUF4118 domain-containing protein, partial [Thermotogota bacterium]